MDTRTPAQRRKIMQSVGTKNTGPELQVRKMLWSLGKRYRLHRKNLPGRPDIVFPGRKKAIFVHGCFWHSHGCKIGQPPKSRSDYWQPKLAKNVERDRTNIELLEADGWSVLVVWQCELKDPEILKMKLSDFLEEN